MAIKKLCNAHAQAKPPFSRAGPTIARPTCTKRKDIAQLMVGRCRKPAGGREGARSGKLGHTAVCQCLDARIRFVSVASAKTNVPTLPWDTTCTARRTSGRGGSWLAVVANQCYRGASSGKLGHTAALYVNVMRHGSVVFVLLARKEICQCCLGLYTTVKCCDKMRLN